MGDLTKNLSPNDSEGSELRTKGRPKGKLKDGKTISCYIRSDIYEALVKHCEITGQTKTIAIERAIEQMTAQDKNG